MLQSAAADSMWEQKQQQLTCVVHHPDVWVAALVGCGGQQFTCKLCGKKTAAAKKHETTINLCSVSSRC